MKRTTVVIIGAGHAGLAMSRRLAQRSIDHVVLERGEVANSWRTERWDSLRLLTPNWLTRLPGLTYRGEDPDGFMTMPEVVRFIGGYAVLISAPVVTGTAVTRVRPTGRGYAVHTEGGVWACAAVVLATGTSNLANVPALGRKVPPSLRTLTSLGYRSPASVGEGGVLIVGASATGIQLADELRRSGRPVTVAVGEHVRLPRLYRGRDIFWWMDQAGVLDERYDEVDDLTRARSVPSPQLIGSPERRSIDLNTLVDDGVELVGRLGAIDHGVARFSGGLPNACTLADLKMDRLLGRLDEWALRVGPGDVDPPQRFAATRVPVRPALELDLGRSGIETIIWATGYRPDHSFVDLPVFDGKGRIRHVGGVVVGAPGMYLLGANLLRRRRSSFIHGAEQDTEELSQHLQDHLDRRGPGPGLRPLVRS